MCLVEIRVKGLQLIPLFVFLNSMLLNASLSFQSRPWSQVQKIVSGSSVPAHDGVDFLSLRGHVRL